MASTTECEFAQLRLTLEFARAVLDVELQCRAAVNATSDKETPWDDAERVFYELLHAYVASVAHYAKDMWEDKGDDDPSGTPPLTPQSLFHAASRGVARISTTLSS